MCGWEQVVCQISFFGMSWGMELLLVSPEVQLVYVAHPEGALITF